MSTTTDRAGELADAASAQTRSRAGDDDSDTTTAAAAVKRASTGIVPVLSWPLRLLCLAGAVALAWAITLAFGVLARAPA